MRQEYHYTLTRTDRICLIMFMMVLLGWELIKYLLPPIPIARVFPDSGWSKVEQEIASTLDSIQQNEGNTVGEKISMQQHEISRHEQTLASPVAIMTASRDELLLAGFSFKAASNIQKYIGAGGVIRSEKDILKIYGMDTAQWNIAKAWIKFPESDHDTTSSRSKYPKKERVNVVIDLNAATSADLEALPGIGSVLAGRIISFRDNLGGFIAISQLKECYGLPPETYDAIQPQLTIHQPANKIHINQVDVKSVVHPYLPRKMLRILDAYRKQHGALASPSDLRKIYPPDTSWCERLIPYVVFD